MMRVAVPLHRVNTIAQILRMGGQGSSHRVVLDPVLQQLDGALIEDGHAILLITGEERQIAAYHIATFGDFDGKLCLLFTEATPVEADVLQWRP